MADVEDVRADALRKAERVGAFESRNDSHLSPIDGVLTFFPEKIEKWHSDLSFGHVTIAGRVMLRRDAGKKLIFLTVQDRSGSMQVAINPGKVNNKLSNEDMETCRQNIGVWDILSFEGDLSFSNTGERTLWVSHPPVFMSKSLRSAPDKVAGLQDKEIVRRQRYLDLLSNKESMARFMARSRIISRIRDYLEHAEFIEVETPVLQLVPNGAAARPFKTELNALSMDMTLRIATEIALKKLLVGGLERVYEIGRIFRNEGLDNTHNPEFTSLEVYQAYTDIRGMKRLLHGIACAAVGGVFGPGGCAEDGDPWLKPIWPEYDYIELIAKHAEVDPWDEEALRARLRRAWKNDPFKTSVGVGEVCSSNLDLMPLVEMMEEAFGRFVQEHLQEPCLVCRQPLALSPLCQADEKDPRLAQRFEMYAGGMEIANAYTELNDPAEQRKRLEAQGIVDEEFIEALEYGMPAAGGLGIGIDRLVMLLTKAESIRDVILFPLMRPEGR